MASVPRDFLETPSWMFLMFFPHWPIGNKVGKGPVTLFQGWSSRMMRFKESVASALATVLLLWPVQGFSDDRSGHLATLEWEPFVGEHLEDLGFGAEILREAFHRAGYRVSFSFMPWVRALKEVEIGTYDAVCFAYHSRRRSRKYLFSSSYAKSILGFCKLRGSGIRFHSLQDLRPYRIGVVRGFVNTPEFDALESLKKEEVKNEQMNLKKLLNRRIDLIVIDKFILQHLLERDFPGQKDAVQFLAPPLTVQPLHLMFSKKLESSEGKVRAFNQALETMKNEGEIEAIMERFGYAYAD